MIGLTSPAAMAKTAGGYAAPVAASVPKLRPILRNRAPNLKVERELWGSGNKVVVGVDEVGRGAWAGPLTVGMAVVPKNRRIYKLRDSKMLTEEEREALFDRVAGWCTNWAVGHASHEECDQLGMSDAQRLAARRALDLLEVTPDRILIDGRWDFVGGRRTIRLVRGDATSVSISAASILAKVVRDRIMRSLSPYYPSYGFEANKGYPCPRHKAALQAWGPSTIHRRSWIFMDRLPWTGIPRYIRPADQGILFETSDYDP